MASRHYDCDPQFQHLRAQDLPDLQLTFTAHLLDSSRPKAGLSRYRGTLRVLAIRVLDTSAGISPTVLNCHESSRQPTASVGSLPRTAKMRRPEVHDSSTIATLKTYRTTTTCGDIVSTCGVIHCLGLHG